MRHGDLHVLCFAAQINCFRVLKSTDTRGEQTQLAVSKFKCFPFKLLRKSQTFSKVNFIPYQIKIFYFNGNDKRVNYTHSVAIKCGVFIGS